jgi:hypothetical protein
MTKQITKLTAAQEARLIEFREEWLKVGLCCDPADFKTGDEVIRGSGYPLHTRSPNGWGWIVGGNDGGLCLLDGGVIPVLRTLYFGVRSVAGGLVHVGPIRRTCRFNNRHPFIHRTLSVA